MANQNDQNITELPIKTNTGVASTDYMLGIDSAEGYQILVRDVAKYIVENYNGSSLAGSAQTPKSAIDSLQTATTQEQLRNIDLNTLTEPTRYYFAAGDNGCTNVPSGVNSFGLIVYRTAGGFRVQILISSGTGTYIRKYVNNAWTDWEMEPTRSEITELNSNTWKKEPSTYTGNVDADNYTTPGFYSVGISTHSPFGSTVAYGVLIVFTSSLGGVQQLFMAAHNGNLYVRGKNRGTDAFSSWYKMTTTIVN